MLSSWKRKQAPIWPPSKKYVNLSSTDDFNMEPTRTKTPMVSSATLSSTAFSTPHLSNDVPHAPRKGGWIGHGWRGGARIAFMATVFVFLVNVILMVLMTSSLYKHMDGFTMLYIGTCTAAERRNSWIHLCINTLGTMVLAASNFCMQLLSAPNRQNVDDSHARGQWLDIGIPSLRNLRSLGWKRRVLWWSLALSSIPLHLIYNSVFYAAIATNDYNVLYATQDFTTGGKWDQRRFSDTVNLNVTDLQRRVSTFERFDNHDCIQAYAQDFVTEYKNVIAVVRNTNTTTSLLDVAVNEIPDDGQIGPSYDAFAWICNDTLTSNKTTVDQENEYGFIPCRDMARKLEGLANTWWRSGGYDIQYCLAERKEPDCHLHFAPQLMAPVLFVNLIKVLVMFYVAFRLRERPLVTLGDAIESFTRHPDPTTEGLCLATAEHIQRHWATGYAPAPLRYQYERRFWGSIMRKRQWILLMSTFAGIVAGVCVCLYFGVRTLNPATIANGWSLGVGIVRTQNLIMGWQLPQLGTNAVLLSAVVANSPQILFSFVYVLYNAAFTTMFVGEDWDRWGKFESRTGRNIYRFLRVSEPRGEQKSTHFLQLPYRFAIPLIVGSGVMHWLVSQTIFLANISVYPRDGTLPRHDEITTCAFSPQGMIWLLTLIVVMVTWIAVNAFRRFNGHMVIVGSNSAAISAACHAEGVYSRAEREEMVLKKLAWGDVRMKHTSVTSKRPSLAGLGMKGDNGSFDGTESTTTNNNNVYHNPNRSMASLPRGVSRFEEEEMMADHDSMDTGLSTGTVGHCTFSDGIMWRPQDGKLYA